ncbi:hypothetical protein [Nonomuraea cavernae]|uniref:Uncharacterized protein n=1 Tax=Nonomuraea cavernae TaxID=2045107 RepID=A0A917ZAB0_9ACTN|nr:hypothetical protein [Nonomuraea cavernae]MCA2186382.1 hypothetical protein [Nonomuraea cavernae]GGO79298.1 hypothetical protein GCM10012289_63270 [Nonomuraea cavernae]
MNLRDTYHELEQDARDYADAGRALRVLRRRRIARTAAGAACAALVIVGGVGLRQSLTHPSGDTIVAVPATSGSAEPSPAYPALPASGPIGRGAAVYTPCRHACPTLLAVTDGRRYLLGTRTVNPPGNLTLSPDGRWLGRPTASGYELRDLLGDTTHRVASPSTGGPDTAYSPWTWSADSRRVILGYHASGKVAEYTDVDLATGRLTTPRLPDGYEPVGILPSGELVLLDRSQDGESTRRQVKLRTDGSTVTLQATGDGVLADADHGLSVQVSGGRIFLLEYTGEKVAVLEFGQGGALVSRTPLADGHYAVGPTPDGYAVIQLPPDQRTGRLRLLSAGRLLHEFPGEAEIVIPGGARH